MPAPRVFDQLFAALVTLKNRTNFSEKCRDGLANLKVGTNSIDPEMLMGEAQGVYLGDGTQEQMSIQKAYTVNASVGTAAQSDWDAKYPAYMAARSISHTSVSDVFAVRPDINAWTPFGGLTIYINPNRLNGANRAQNQGLMMHELLHEGWGLDDSDIMNSLGISKADQARGSVAISNWLRDNCVNGKGNNQLDSTFESHRNRCGAADACWSADS